MGPEQQVIVGVMIKLARQFHCTNYGRRPWLERKKETLTDGIVPDLSPER